jgi:hypothetical protein
MGSATGESAKRLEIHRGSTVRDKVRVEEVLVSELIVGVIVDVLVHVPIEDLESLGIGSIPAPARDLGVLDTTEFVVLHPKIGLEYFGRRCEAEQRSVSLC